jgi:hypothetical protein
VEKKRAAAVMLVRSHGEVCVLRNRGRRDRRQSASTARAVRYVRISDT